MTKLMLKNLYDFHIHSNNIQNDKNVVSMGPSNPSTNVHG